MLLTGSGWSQVPPPPLLRLADFPDTQRDRVRGIYHLLDGDPTQFDRIRPGGWDLAFETPGGPLFVELDEEQHFNRYRAQTLTATADLDLPWAADYLAFCEQHEQRLLPGWGTGKRWTNTSAARFFGDPSAPGDFTGVGAPRWRQRAFYDSVKDILTKRHLARISVYDTLETGGTVEVLLRGPDPVATAGLHELIVGRIHHA